MNILPTLLLVGLIVGGMSWAWRIGPRKSKLVITRGQTHFPLVSGNNLDRQELVFPRDFGGDLNLVIVPFQQYQQFTVNTWIPYLQKIEAANPGFIYYELPTISDMPALSRIFINEGMRAGIPDPIARQRTITLYIDKANFKSVLDIPHENDIYLFLVDRQGDILWRVSGEYTLDKAEELAQAVQANR